jgi:presenilin-like A22 family membrane protease
MDSTLGIVLIIGLVVLASAVGITLHVLAVPYGLVIAAAVAFLAAFLNAVFGLCLGCELYRVLLRLRVSRPAPHA